MVLEHQLQAALQRTSALRARAAKQQDFSCAQQVAQLQRILVQSQRLLNKFQASGPPKLCRNRIQGGVKPPN